MTGHEDAFDGAPEELLKSMLFEDSCIGTAPTRGGAQPKT